MRVAQGEDGTHSQQKYLRCLGHSFTEYFDFEVTEVGMEGDGLPGL